MQTGKWYVAGVLLVLAWSLALPGMGQEGGSEEGPAAAPPTEPRNVILMIADGCGFNHILATDYYQYGEPGHQAYQRGFEALAMSTYSNEGTYDPNSVYGSFDSLKENPTDSAAAATAIATGVKTYNAAVGVGPDGKPLITAVQAAESAGKATGVVTTVPLSHATPASFVAHNESRGNYADIAREMLLHSATDVIMGGGHPWFDANSEFTGVDTKRWNLRKAIEEQHQFVGGLNTWLALVAGVAGSDADGDGDPDPWVLVDERVEFQRLACGQWRPARVAGVFQAPQTAQQSRAGIDGKPEDDAPYETPRNEAVPTLAEMVRGALNVLSQDPDGFFLMIEAGAVDWASHGNQLGRMIEEVSDLNCAAQAVVNWVEANGGWEENLVILTADHETGYLVGPGSNPEWKPVENRGRGQLPGAEWHSTGHTNQLVPFYVRGFGSERLLERATNQDPQHGRYLDNTDLGQVLVDMLQEAEAAPAQ